MLILLYLYGVQQQSLLNSDMTRIDQSSYLQAAKTLKTSNYTALTNRNQMPVYPFLLSLLYEPGLDDETFFARGKLLNVGLSLLILSIFFWIFYRYLPLFTAVNLLLIHALTLYMFKAPFVQAELLFYLLNFVGFLLMCRLLWQPEAARAWQTAVFTGIVLGVAHLTKASVLPGLLLFTGAAVLQATARWIRKRPFALPNRRFWQTIAMPLLVMLFFLLTIWPYIQNSKEQFGRYFYNVNATFYIWYDHWDEVEAGTRAHGDRVAWPDMPPEQIPSAAKYLTEHTAGQIFNRFFEGLLAIYITTTKSYGYVVYFTLLFLFVFSLAVVNWKQTLTIIRERPFVTLFISSFFVSYILLYAWYWPISSGNRFSLALFSPAMFTLAYVGYRLFGRQLQLSTTSSSKAFINVGRLLNWILLAILWVDGYIILTERISTLFGGF